MVVVELHLRRGILLGEAAADGVRLLDLFNGPEAVFVLRRAHAAPARGAGTRPLGEAAVPKAEILLALPYDARGLLPLALRREWAPTAREPVVADVGPLRVRGTLHGPREAGNPLAAVLAGRERRAFLPLTEVLIEHRDGWSLEHPTVFVRRGALSLVAAVAPVVRGSGP